MIYLVASVSQVLKQCRKHVHVILSESDCSQHNLQKHKSILFQTHMQCQSKNDDFVLHLIGLGDILHVICMRISSVKPVP